MYIGNTPTTQVFTFGTDSFDGNGVTLQFTLSRSVPNAYAITVIVNNVPQNPFTNSFSVSNNILTFTEAPSIGTKNVWVFYNSYITQLIQPGYKTVGINQIIDGAVGTAQLALGAVTPTELDRKYVEKDSNTGAAVIPTGTTAQRPVTPVFGMIRGNSTTGQPEWYQELTNQWINMGDAAPYLVEYIIVAGGGGGGGVNNVGSGGGGAGGYVFNSVGITPGSSFTIVVGGGGSGGSGGGYGSIGGNGSNSSFGAYSAIGGGAGAVRIGTEATSGGSGGGGGANSNGAVGTSGQGYAGANSLAYYQGGGGGGAGAAATNVNGGIGKTDTWTGSTRYLAGGGGGGGGNGNSAGTGGNGGGGNGNGGSGSSNTGGGGAGSYAYQAQTSGGSGGSGIVIIRYIGSQRGSGGSVSSFGGYTMHTFTSSGTFTA